jgi:iron complex outermembrane receptor protein
MQTRIPLARAVAQAFAMIAATVPTAFAAPAPAPATAKPAADALGEIVVTARKREETVQTVPLAITAFTAEAIERQRIESIQDVAQFTPGLVYQNINGTLALPVIRGLAQANIASDNNVGMFLNGVYLSSNRTLDIGLVDLARIEVVKGPQSALYGQNSFSGAINYVTQRAPAEGEASVSGSGGSEGYYEARASVGGPIGGGMLRGRLAAAWTGFDGTFDNQAGGTLQGYRNKGLSAELAFSPTDAFDARLFAYWSDQDNDMPAQYLVANNCGRTATGAPTYFCGTLPELDTFDISKGVYGRQSENRIASLDLEYRFGGAWALKSITAYVRGKSDSFFDFDYTSTGVPFAVRNTTTGAVRNVLTNDYLGQGGGGSKDRSQELRLTYSTERLQAMVGAFWYDSERQDFSRGSVDSTVLRPGEVFVSPLAQTFATADPFGRPVTSGLSFDDVTTKALFAQVGVDVAPGLRVTAEARRARDEKRVRRVLNFGAPVTVNPVQSAEFTYTTPRFTVDWQARDHVLLYASYAKGVRSGGFNQRATLAAEAAYEPEQNKTYEVGAKTQWLDRRLTANLALYYVDWTNLQLTSRSIDPSNIFNLIRNTGDAISSGFEFELRAAPVEALQFGLGYANANPRFKAGARDLGLSAFCGVAAGVCPNFTSAADLAVRGVDVGGQQLGRTVREQYNAFVEVGLPFGAGEWRWYARADWAQMGRQPVSALEVQFIDGYSIVNARLGVASDRYEIAAWAKNLGDESYITATSQQPRFHTGAVPDVTFGYGRIVGVTATARFGGGL